MPLSLAQGTSTLVVRKTAFEKAGLVRAQIDTELMLTDQEFRVEHDLVVIGPLFDPEGLVALVELLERRGLLYFDDFFEMSGNWPEWLSVFAAARTG